MRKAHEAKLLHYLTHFAGWTNSHGLDHRAARNMRNDSRKLIQEIWPNSQAAKDIDEWRKTSPDFNQ